MTNAAVTALIQTTLADMRPRIRITATNVDTLTTQLAAAEEELSSLVDQYNSLAASLPQPEQDAAYAAISAELNPDDAD
ncbi:hypothetical protein [Microbacterium sp. 22296]|uniref:hypothetical protein n=1 Tax=Microbacterium sp. 22296 TaxID=3453903 RepID=UPI003F856A8E